jgi:hypothetical protein
MARKQDDLKPGPCPKKCTQGEKCCLNGNVRHSLHICMCEECNCHSEERYRKALQSDGGEESSENAVESAESSLGQE